jgi:uncharacterized Tic20 family protein
MHPNDGRVVSNFIIQVFFNQILYLSMLIFIGIYIYIEREEFICIINFIYTFTHIYFQVSQGKDITIYGTVLHLSVFIDM